jgi:hypothetical protein
MVQLSPDQAPPELRSLFDPCAPAGIRCFAVLEGHAAGCIWTDDPACPAWAVLQEAGFGSLYLGGALDATVLRQVITRLHREGDVLIGLWPGDERFGLLPAGPDYDGAVLEFSDRLKSLDAYLQVPAGCEVRRMDRALFVRSRSCTLIAAIFGGVDKALSEGLGICLMEGEEILSEAFAGPAALGLIELGTETGEAVQRRGYATITCAHLARACEGLGYRTYWNCDKENRASAAVARKLGFETEREYRLWAWFK